MTWAQAKAAATAHWFRTGDPFLDTAVVYGGVTITAGVKYGENLDVESDFNYKGQFASATIRVLKTDVAAFAYDTTVTFDSKTWKTRELVSDDDISWLIKVASDERPEVYR